MIQLDWRKFKQQNGGWINNLCLSCRWWRQMQFRLRPMPGMQQQNQCLISASSLKNACLASKL